MINASDVRQKLDLLAVRKLSLNAFESWVESHVWDVEQDSSEDAWDLVYSIRLLFSERDNHRFDSDDLRRRLLALANDAVMSIQFNSELRPISQHAPSLSAAWLFASPYPDPVQVFRLRPA